MSGIQHSVSSEDDVIQTLQVLNDHQQTGVFLALQVETFAQLPHTQSKVQSLQAWSVHVATQIEQSSESGDESCVNQAEAQHSGFL